VTASSTSIGDVRPAARTRLRRRSRTREGRAQRLRLAVRLVFLAIAAHSLLWASTAGVRTWRASQLAELAERAWSGETFRPEALARVLKNNPAKPGGACRSADEAQALALIAFVQAARAVNTRPDAPATRQDIGLLERYAEAGSACAPARAWPWLLLFWARTKLEGFDVKHLHLLWMSYRLAPREKDIQQTRSAIVLRAYHEQLPLVGQELVLMEFRELVDAGYVANAAETFSLVPGELRAKLIRAVEQLPEPKRQAFADAVRRLGVEIRIAGVSDLTHDAWDPHLSGADKMRSLLRKLDGTGQYHEP